MNNAEKETQSIEAQQIIDCVRVIRGVKVMLDSDLAKLYGVETKILVQSVKRNAERFPMDFMFQLSTAEWSRDRVRGGRRHPPYAFTEHGVAMLSSVLSSSQAILVNIEIVRVFVRVRELLLSNAELAGNLAKVQHKLEAHDVAISDIMAALQELLRKPEQSLKRPIGFVYPES